MNEDDIVDVSAPTTSSSPLDSHDNKCPVCLQVFTNSKAYASHCFHSFCFECLLEWSKIKYNCPLCKRPLDRIVFSVKSALQFKEYLLKPKENAALNLPLEIIESNTSGQLVNKSNQSKASWVSNKQQAPIEFRMLVYLNEWYSCSQQIQFVYKIANLEEEFGDKSVINSTETAVASNDESLEIFSYKAVKSFRNTTPKWFKKNPACTHRLMQFIYRELKAIACVLSSSKLPNYLNIQKRSHLFSMIINTLKEHDLNSEEFLNTIKEFINPIRVAKHFQHELNMYAASICSSVADYDSKCVYYADLNFVLNGLGAAAPVTFPLTLPVNLSKYRLILNTKDHAEVITLENSSSDYSDEDGVRSAGSSFCEEVATSPKASPNYIVLSSSSRSRSRSPLSPARPKSSSSRRKSKKKKKKHADESSTSSHHTKKHKKKKKKRSRDHHD